MKNPSELTNNDIGTKLYNKKDNSEHIFVGRYRDDGICINNYRILTIIDSTFSKCYLYTSDTSNIVGDIDNIFTLEKPKEEPIVDWSALPAWFNWVAMDKDGSWFTFRDKPTADNGCWNNYDLNEDYIFIDIPPEYTPKFNGDWKDSLVERPK